MSCFVLVPVTLFHSRPKAFSCRQILISSPAPRFARLQPESWKLKVKVENWNWKLKVESWNFYVLVIWKLKIESCRREKNFYFLVINKLPPESWKLKVESCKFKVESCRLQLFLPVLFLLFLPLLPVLVLLFLPALRPSMLLSLPPPPTSEPPWKKVVFTQRFIYGMEWTSRDITSFHILPFYSCCLW